MPIFSVIQKNNLNNVEFYVGKAEEVVPKMYSEGKTANVVVVDPPRKGLDKKTIAVLQELEPSKIIYISCNPATLARDILRFDTLGYKLEKATAVDMFPRTGHVETVALLRKTK